MTLDDWANGASLARDFYTKSGAGSDQAYTELTELLLPYLRTCFCRHGLREEAEDLAWDILVKFWQTKGRAEYDAATPLKAWLDRVVRNHIIDRNRRAQVRSAAELPPDDLLPESCAIEVQSRSDLEAFGQQHAECLGKLKPEHRKVYDRHCVRTSEGGSVESVIANPLGLTYSEASSRLHLARRQMKRCLEVNGFELMQCGSPIPSGASIVALFRDPKTGACDTMLVHTPSRRG